MCIVIIAAGATDYVRNFMSLIFANEQFKSMDMPREKSIRDEPSPFHQCIHLVEHPRRRAVIFADGKEGMVDSNKDCPRVCWASLGCPLELRLKKIQLFTVPIGIQNSRSLSVVRVQ